MRWNLPAATLFLGLPFAAHSQWCLGPQVQVTALHRDPVVVLAGLGASATYNTSKRAAVWGDLRFHFPNRTNTSHTSGGPAGLQTGDTTLSTYDVSTSEYLLSAVFGFQRTFNRSVRAQEWFWAFGLGFGASQELYHGQYTDVHSGEQGNYQGADLSPCLIGRLGVGHTTHFPKADLVCALTDDWACSSDNNMTWPSSNAGHHSIALAVSYRWRL